MTEPVTPPSHEATAPRGGRRLLMAGAMAAGLAGLGVALWRQPAGSGAAGTAAPSGGAAGPEAEHFWAQRLDTPTGEPLALATLRGRPLLVNFWATWCPPCIEELPMIDAFHRQQASGGVQVLGIAIDQPSAVRKYLQATPLAFPVVIGGLEGTDLAKRLGNASGALPFSVAFDAAGRKTHFKMGKLSPDDLTAWQRG